MQTLAEEQKDTLENKMVATNIVAPPTSPVPPQISSKPKIVTTSSNANTTELVKVLADALSANRIPIPEPSVFTGDPLKYDPLKH